MDEKKKKLRLPAVLVVVAIASAGCGGTTPPADSAVVADAGLDANCPAGEAYNDRSMRCEPLV